MGDARAAVALLLLISISFAFIDPPIQEVSQHNMEMASNAILHINLYNVLEHKPTIDDPTYFAYARILDITPSVNHTVFSSLHPSIIWLTTEKHASTITKDTRQGCSGSLTVRNFDAQPITDKLTADYSMDGLSGTSAIESETETITTNPQAVPFNDSMMNVSAYATGIINFTSHNMTIRNPMLNASLTWSFHIDYKQQQTSLFLMNDGSCESETHSSSGSVTYLLGDFASYVVQDNHSAIIPFSPSMLSLDGNTTENVTYKGGFLSDGPVYKYYLKMDDKIAGACYFYNFTITNDSYGIESINATLISQTGLMGDDPQVVNNYTASHKTNLCRDGIAFLDSSPITNQSHNYSDVYYFVDEFEGLAKGAHVAELQFYSLSGLHSSAYSNIIVKGETSLVVRAHASNGQLIANCVLASNGLPVPGRQVEIKALGQTAYELTDANGICAHAFQMGKATGGVSAQFDGDGQYLQSNSFAVIMAIPSINPQGDIFSSNTALVIIIVGLFGLSLSRLTRSAVSLPFRRTMRRMANAHRNPFLKGQHPAAKMVVSSIRWTQHGKRRKNI